MFVQFEDQAQEKIVAVFGCKQDKNTFPNQGEVEDNDPRYLVFINPPAPDPVKAVDKLLSFLSENPDVADLLK